jgi:hypothetical protein
LIKHPTSPEHGKNNAHLVWDRENPDFPQENCSAFSFLRDVVLGEKGEGGKV